MVKLGNQPIKNGGWLDFQDPCAGHIPQPIEVESDSIICETGMTIHPGDFSIFCFLLNSTQVDFNKDTPKWASSIVGSRLLSKNTPSIYLSESRKASVVGLLYCSSFSRGSRPE